MHQASPRSREFYRWRLLRYSLQSSPLLLAGGIATGAANAQVPDLPAASEVNPPHHQISQSASELQSISPLVATSSAPESFVGMETTRLATTEPTAVSNHPAVEAIAQPIFSTSLHSAPTDSAITEVAQTTVPDTLPSTLERRPNNPSVIPEIRTIPTPSLNDQQTEPLPPHTAPISQQITVTDFQFVFGSLNEVCEETSQSAQPKLFEREDLHQRIYLGDKEGRVSLQTGSESGSQLIGDFLRNRTLSTSQLIEVSIAVAKFYANEGYSTSGAVVCIPEATKVSGEGEIVIRIIEGQLEELETFQAANREPEAEEAENRNNSESSTSDSDPSRANPSTRLEHYIESRLGVEAGEPLNVARLQERLALFQLDDPLIEGISAKLSAGAEAGNSRLRIEVDEENPFSFSTNIDNGRAPSVGSLQRQVQLGYGNVLGLGDRLSVGYSNTDGSNRFDASYTIPLNPDNGTLALSYGTSSNTVIEPPFDTLDIESTSQTYDLTYRQPIIRRICRLPGLNNPNCPSDREEANLAQSQPQSPIFEEFAVGLTASVRDSQTFLLDEPFSLSLGTEADGRSRVSALRFFQEWTQQSDRSVFAVRSQFNIGLNVLGATVQESDDNGEIPDSRFVSWQGQAQLVQVLNSQNDVHRDTLLTLRTNAQLADQFMLSSEQFAIGGAGTVRGYRQDSLQSDNGIFASAELQFPVIRVPGWDGTFYLVPFVDAGIGWNNGDRPDPNPGALASVGIGLRWQMRDPNITARLDWGIPLVSIDGERDRTWQENGIHFSVSFGL